MMWYSGVLLLVSLSVCLAGPFEDQAGHIFTSTHKLSQLMDMEAKSVNIMKEYIAHQRLMIANVRRAQEKMAESIPDPKYYTGIDHPINAYKLINRFVAHWKNVYVMIFNETNHKLYKDQIYTGLGNLRPHLDDYHGSYKSLLRLQYTYDLSAKRMADGLIQDKMSDPLDQTDCYNMALTAVQAGLCNEALQWTRLAGDRADTEHEQWDINHDVADFEQRLQLHGPEKMKNIILDYLMDAIGYNDDHPEEEEEEEEEIIYQDVDEAEYVQDQQPIEVKPIADKDDDGDEDEDELDIDEVASDDYREGELNIAQFSSEMEQELEQMDNYEYLKQAQAEQMKLAEEMQAQQDLESEDSGEDAGNMKDAMQQAFHDLESSIGEGGGQPVRSQCGNVDQIIEERTIEYSSVGHESAGGKILKMKYQGKDIDESELDKLQKLAEQLVDNSGRGNEFEGQRSRYYSLCRGEEVIERDLSELTCRYRQADLAYNVWKEEMLSKDPLIVMIYDFMTDDDVKHVKDLSKQHLLRAMAGEKFIDGRVQSSSWHDDENSTHIEELSSRTSTITGLDCKNSAEVWQVGQYGIGGHYDPHYDYNPKRFLKTEVRGKIMGDRIATFMVYLNDVEAGGYTVFPDVGIHIPPVKKAAVFWYNYSLSGEPDTRLLHAGCPVLMGHKWVANKWIRQYGNEFTRPCGKTKAVTDYHIQINSRTI